MNFLQDTFPADMLDCGTTGWTIPIIYWGDCPIVMCMLKPSRNDPLTGT